MATRIDILGRFTDSFGRFYRRGCYGTIDLINFNGMGRFFCLIYLMVVDFSCELIIDVDENDEGFLKERRLRDYMAFASINIQTGLTKRHKN